MSETLGVVGTGSFGTALAIVLGQAGHRVKLWGRRPEQVAAMHHDRRNALYLSEVELPETVEPTADFADLAGLRVVLFAVPSHGFREILRELLAHPDIDGGLTLVSATKGMETETLARMSQVTAEEAARVDRPVRFAVLSGPTFALELAQGVPTTAVVAAEDLALATELQSLFAARYFRLYTSTDVVGVEIGGAAKNVVAIAAGMLTGIGLGHNTLAALVTRGLHEITRLGIACGGEARTLSGLAGLGDLVLTCTGGLSRNRRMGIELASGRSLDEINAGTTTVAEGVRNSLAVARLATLREVSMPITSQMMEVIHRGKPVRQAVAELMSRALRQEAEL